MTRIIRVFRYSNGTSMQEDMLLGNLVSSQSICIET